MDLAAPTGFVLRREHEQVGSPEKKRVQGSAESPTLKRVGCSIVLQITTTTFQFS